MGLLFFLLIFLAWCLIIRKWQTKRIKFYFQPTYSVWKDLLAQTKLSTMRYQPSFFTLTSELQVCWFPFVELWQKATDKLRYNREIFSLSDGGECALDWVEQPDSATRDIVVVVPGLSSASDQLNCREIAKACLASNLDCVVVNWRGLGNVPLKVSFRPNHFQTAKIYNAAVNDDLEEVVEYIFQEHCLDDQGNQTRRLTGVGISLGSSVLANLAARLGTRNRFDAHFGLCCHFEWRTSFDFVKQKLFGVFDYVLGLGMTVTLRDSFIQFDQLAQKKCPERLVGHLVEKARTLTNDWSMIAAISGGFTYEEYLDKSDVTPVLHKIQ